jgi:hypothetical protein
MRIETKSLRGSERTFVRQPKSDLYPTSQTRFIIKIADAEINFIKDTQGQVVQLILRLS